MKRIIFILITAVAGVLSAVAAPPQKGYRGFVEWVNDIYVDISLSGASEGAYYTGASTSHGYQFNRWLYVGGGAAWVRWPKFNKNYSIPVFADVRFDLPFGRFTPYVDIKLGYDFCHRIVDEYFKDKEDEGSGGIYFAPTIGYRVGLPYNLGLNFGIGMTMKGYRYSLYSYMEQQYYAPRHYTENFLTLRLALDF